MKKDYSWLFPVLSCLLLTILIVWLFEKSLPLLILKLQDGSETLLICNFLSGIKGFNDFSTWLLIIFPIIFVLSAIITGIFLVLWRFFLKKVKVKKLINKGLFGSQSNSK